MGAGLSANRLYGTCQTIPARICEPYREVCVHTITSSPYVGTGIFSSGNTWGCKTLTTTPNTQPLPGPIIPDVINKPPIYGKTENTVQMDGYFITADLVNWRERSSTTGFGTVYSRGPAIKQGHSVTCLRRRPRDTNPNYVGKNNFYFTDSDDPLNGVDDWMGVLHPADVIWTNKGINEPFLAVNYFEDCGQNPTKVDVYNQSFIPFCTPLNCYNSSNSLIGQFVGYTFMFYFSKSFMRIPTTVNLPEDYYTIPPRPKVVPTSQFFSLDCHLFIVANPVSPNTLKSKKLNSIRIWFYNKDGTQWNMCNQYVFLLGQGGNWNFDVGFNHVGGGSETINFGMNNLRFYLTP